MATHISVLAWRISWTEEPDRLQSMGLQSGTLLKNLACTHTNYAHGLEDLIILKNYLS